MAAVKMQETGVVIPMNRFTKAAPLPQFAQLDAYWEALKPMPDRLPSRSDFDPRGISDLLHQTLLLERIAPGQVRIRLAGVALQDRMGMELRGMPFSALLSPETREAFATQIERVFTEPARAHLILSADRGTLRRAVSAQMLVLPMLGHAGAVDRAIACLVCEGEASVKPARLSLTSAQVQPLEVQLSQPARPMAGRNFVKSREEKYGFAEPLTPFAPQSAAEKARTYLRLVKG